MALPKKKHVPLKGPNQGNYGLDGRNPYSYAENWGENQRAREIAENIQQGRGYLPESVLHEDYDKGFIKFMEEECELILPRVNAENEEIVDKTPVVFLSLQRWREFEKTWSFSDPTENPVMPFITVVRRIDSRIGQTPSTLYTIPDRKLFPYMYVRTYNGNTNGVDVYQVPQPVPIDMTYEVRLFSTKMRDLNKFNLIMLRHFTSLQKYINVNGHYTPLTLQEVSDESQIDNVEGRRFYVQSYEIVLSGNLIDKDEFKVTPAVQQVIVVQEVSNNVNKKSSFGNMNYAEPDATGNAGGTGVPDNLKGVGGLNPPDSDDQSFDTDFHEDGT